LSGRRMAAITGADASSRPLALAPPDEAEQEEEHDGADGRYHQADPEAAAHRHQAKNAEHKRPDEGTDEPDDEVGDEPVAAVHHLLGDPARQDPDDDRSEDTNALHECPLTVERKARKHRATSRQRQGGSSGSARTDNRALRQPYTWMTRP